MPRLTVKALSEQIKDLTKILVDDVKLKFHLHHEQIMALRHDRDYMRKELSDVSYCLAQQLTINDLHNERMDQQSRQIQSLTQLAAQQADTIALLTDKVSELASELNQLGETVNDLGDEEALTHQWLDRQQSRIVALEKREMETFTLSGSNAARLDIHGAWIGQIFDRINEEVKE